jgi:hypothetical protein
MSGDEEVYGASRVGGSNTITMSKKHWNWVDYNYLMYDDLQII